MKRLWIGILAVTVLLVGGIWASLGLLSVHNRLSGQLYEAAIAAQKDDMAKARELMADAEKYWEKHRAFTAAFSDHEPIEQIDQLFARARICREMGLSAQYALICAELSEVSSAIGEGLKLNWWNLL